MTTKTDGGEAFPCPSTLYPDGSVHEIGSTGLSKRDWFAGLAMQAAATNPAGADGFTFEQRAEWAYQQADAMLAAREK